MYLLLHGINRRRTVFAHRINRDRPGFGALHTWHTRGHSGDGNADNRWTLGQDLLHDVSGNMTNHNVAVDEHCVTALKLFRHARLQGDPLEVVSVLDIDLKTILAQIRDIPLAAGTVRILIERCVDWPGQDRG